MAYDEEEGSDAQIVGSELGAEDLRGQDLMEIVLAELDPRFRAEFAMIPGIRQGFDALARKIVETLEEGDPQDFLTEHRDPEQMGEDESMLGFLTRRMRE